MQLGQLGLSTRSGVTAAAESNTLLIARRPFQPRLHHLTRKDDKSGFGGKFETAHASKDLIPSNLIHVSEEGWHVASG